MAGAGRPHTWSPVGHLTDRGRPGLLTRDPPNLPHRPQRGSRALSRQPGHLFLVSSAAGPPITALGWQKML